ncbi:MAG: hypothetical protein AMJ45_02325 [Syntrophobacter sp. DG_60]|nr:MAG: hypothetical protein AMJ45_02325 [Syntrophobacter sp. DG_60]
MWLNSFWKALCLRIKWLGEGFKRQSTEVLERELEEMENGFALLTFGALVGLPTLPTYMGLRLLPYLEREILVMFIKSERLDDKLAEWADLADL